MQRHPIEFKELIDSVNELSKREKNNIITKALNYNSVKNFTFVSLQLKQKNTINMSNLMGKPAPAFTLFDTEKKR